jgi:hypothetical protein
MLLVKMSRPTLKVRPVRFPPGLARLSTRPRPTGSLTEIATMGIVLVAFRAATAAGVANCDEDVYLLLDELRREASQSVEVAACIAKFDGNVAALDVAEVFKALAKGLCAFRDIGELGWVRRKPANLFLLRTLLSQGDIGAY